MSYPTTPEKRGLYMRIPLSAMPLAGCAVVALLLAGCFGGEDDASTMGPENPGNPASTRKITPGFYVGDYSRIDSERFAGMESEFLMDADGSFEHLFIYQDDAIFDHSGKWAQSGGDFIFTETLVSESNQGVFDGYAPLEDDTNSVRNVTDSGFTRNEWTPLRQKPYWMAYKRKTDFPKLSQGIYYHHVIDTFTIVADTSDTTGAVDTLKVVDKLYRFEFAGGDTLRFSMTVDSLETYQLEAEYRRFGSFLVTENHRDRGRDTANVFTEWQSKTGTVFMKLKEATETTILLQTPAFSPEPNGFILYSKNGR